MPQTCPIHIAREVERRWERRSPMAPSRGAQDNTHIAAGFAGSGRDTRRNSRWLTKVRLASAGIPDTFFPMRRDAG